MKLDGKVAFVTGFGSGLGQAIAVLFAKEGAAGAGMAGQVGRAAYCASKGGIVTLTEAMAMDYAHERIRVNCICPGPTRTPMVDTSTPEKLARYKTRVPIGRIGEPEDIAYAALYLASDEASMVTAAILPVDGGMRLTGA